MLQTTKSDRKVWRCENPDINPIWTKSFRYLTISFNLSTNKSRNYVEPSVWVWYINGVGYACPSVRLSLRNNVHESCSGNSQETVAVYTDRKLKCKSRIVRKWSIIVYQKWQNNFTILRRFDWNGKFFGLLHHPFWLQLVLVLLRNHSQTFETTLIG